MTNSMETLFHGYFRLPEDQVEKNLVASYLCF